MGGTKILAAAINSSEGIITRVKQPTRSTSNPDSYVKSLAKIVNEVVEKLHLNRGNVKAVCLGIPGSLNPFTGKVGFAPNLGIKNFNISRKLKKLIPYPVLIENDVNIGALGIKNFGAGKKAKNMLAVFVGTGIGGGLIINDKIYRGSNYVAGEVGHMVVKKNGPMCSCGNKGCFEAVASRTAIVKAIVKDIKAGKKSVLKKYVKSGERIKSKVLAQAVAENDPVVVKRLSEGCDTIGIALAGIANLLNVDMIVLGGGVLEAMGNFMLPKIKESFSSQVMKDSAKGLKILVSHLGDDAALYGGIALAEEFLNVKV
jgi:glucokinase